MSDVFISYASSDRERAGRIAQALQERGWSVWWDRTILPGEAFDSAIERALVSARCVVVLWSKASSVSEWVKNEADEGRHRGILVPALLDSVEIPLGFRRIQAARLEDWQGEADHPELNRLCEAVAAVLQPGGSPVTPVQQVDPRRWIKLAAFWSLVVFAVTAAAWVRAFNLVDYEHWPLEYWVEKTVAEYLEPRTKTTLSEVVRMILAAPGDTLSECPGALGPTWRSCHKELVESLSRAGAQVVAFDLFFEEPSDHDSDFGKVIQQATRQGTTIVLGARNFLVEETGVSALISSTLNSYLTERNWGFLNVGATIKEGLFVRKMKLAKPVASLSDPRLRIVESPLVPSFALQVALQGYASSKPLKAFWGAGKVWWRDSHGDTLKATSVDDDLDFIMTVANRKELDDITRPYKLVYENRHNTNYLRQFFARKIVLIGYKSDEDRIQLGQGESRYGVELQASAISALLQGTTLQSLRFLSRTLLIATMAGLGALLRLGPARRARWRLPVNKLSFIYPPLEKKKIELPWLMPAALLAYFLLTIGVMEFQRVVLDFTYPVFALLCMYWISGKRRLAAAR